MPRTHHDHFVQRSGFWGGVAIVACAAQLLCQTLMTDPQTERRLMSTGGTAVEKDIRLGNAYLNGSGVAKDEKLAAWWFQKAAEAGDPWAQQQIGFFYQAGIGVSHDSVQAAHWYQLAAAAGLARAKTNLGVAYLWGVGVPEDKQLAADLFRQAAAKGDGVAATYLGNLYYFGQGIRQDKSAAEHWFMIGAKLHDPIASYDLGMLYSVEDHAHNFGKAVKCLRKSVAGGYVPAIHALALLLENHPELARSNREALALFEKASGYGQWRSSEALGTLYRDGAFVPRDPGSAYYYFQLAALQGGEKEKINQAMQLLASELGNEQAAKLDAAAQAWYQHHQNAIEFFPTRTGKVASSRLAVAAPLPDIHAGQLLVMPPAS